VVEKASEWWGEHWSRSEAASSKVEFHLGRSIAYVQAHSVIVRMVRRGHEATSNAYHAQRPHNVHSN
jgi:hypothetical protein